MIDKNTPAPDVKAEKKPAAPRGGKKSSHKDPGPNKKSAKSFLFKKPKLKKDTTALEKELEQIKKSYQYLQAEFANHKRITLKERHHLIKYGPLSFIKDFLSFVFNDFNQAVQKEWKEKDFENLKKGFSMLCSQTLKTLKSHGVEEVNPLGKVFDPRLHEVLSTRADSSQPTNTVLYVCRKGYTLHDQLIQPAQVIVNKSDES